MEEKSIFSVQCDTVISRSIDGDVARWLATAERTDALQVYCRLHLCHVICDVITGAPSVCRLQRHSRSFDAQSPTVAIWVQL